MNKNLLVGNGLNICLNITELNQESIAQRFREVILRSNPLYENLFKVHFTPNTLNNIFSVVPNQSIETLAYYLYNYIHVNMYDQTTLNSEIRLLNAIKTSALNAIFFEKNHPINLKTDDQKILHHIQKYENVFSLKLYRILG